MEDSNKIISFSHTASDATAITAIAKLKLYSKKHGITFSYLVIKAIVKLVEELENGRKG